MKRTIFQGLITVLLFFGTWFALSQIDWMNVFNVKQVTSKMEQKLGTLLWEFFKKSEKENTNIDVINTLDTIVNHICESNNISNEELKIHIINKDEINAFALPYGHLIVYSGLIINSENQEELTGVICHEIAHIELNHVMKKLIKEIGLSVVISMATGNGGPEVINETIKMLSSSAFDRSLEKEADSKAVDYLINAKVNPKPFADFLYKLSEKENEGSKYMKWLSSHPESKGRAAYIIEYSKGKSTDYKPIISQITWDKLIEELKN